MLEAENLKYRHLGPFSFRIEAGRCTGLTGPSGTGKSLLLRALCDLDPWRGEIRLNDQSPTDMHAPDWRRKIGYLPAESQWWHDQVSLHFPAPPAPPHLQQLGFEQDVLAWEVSRLSSGERQRLALLRLLANQPEALLLDEPTAHLDRDMVTRAEELILTWHRENYLPVLWVSHDRNQLSRVADTYLLLTEGQLTHEGSV
jgi:ABC-type iron transport system FetAB ATPase subunit